MNKNGKKRENLAKYGIFMQFLGICENVSTTGGSDKVIFV